MRLVNVVVFFLLGSSICAYAQGLVLKYVHSSSAVQEYRFSETPDVWQSNLISTYDAWDLDGDGRQDFVAAEHIAGDPTWGIKVYSSVGMEVLWSSTGETPRYTSWGVPMFFDLTGDGVKEIVYADRSEMTFFVYSMLQHECILQAENAYDIYRIMDFDADGILDIGIHRIVAGEEFHLEIWGAGTVQSSPPSDLVITGQNNDLTLNWQPVDSCSMYRVYWSFALNGDYASVGTSCTPNFTHPGAAITPLAFYKVVAITSTNDEQVVGQAVHRKIESNNSQGNASQK